MNEYRELKRNEFENFLKSFALSGSLKYRNNKWIGLTRNGDPFTVHTKHGSSRKYSCRLVEAIAKDLGISSKEFALWYRTKR